MISIRKLISCGYILIFILIGIIIYCYQYEWKRLDALEKENQATDELRRYVNDLNFRLTRISLLGETILEWDNKDIETYHLQRIAVDSILCYFMSIYPSEHIDSLRHILEDKEKQICQIVQILDEQKIIKERIARRVPAIVQKSTQERPKKTRRKGFLGIFGKKEETKPTVTTMMLQSFNQNMIAEQQTKSRTLSEYADSLTARNTELNRQLQELIIQIDGKVQADLQKREVDITAMREQSFIQISILTVFIFLLLVISYPLVELK